MLVRPDKIMLISNKNLKNRIVVITLAIVFLFLISSGWASAAKLSLDTNSKNLEIGQKFDVVVQLDAQGQSINAVEGKLTFPENLEVALINDGGSIINYWIQKPSVSGNSITFSGITPGGFNGSLSSDLKETKAGELFSVQFITVSQGAVQIGFSDVKILLNDGKGTEATTSSALLQLAISQNAVVSTTTPESQNVSYPEFSAFQIYSDSQMTDGKNILIFNAQDKTSGINHYEVRERKTLGFLSLDFSKSDWIVAQSPYILRNQTLKSSVYIKAVNNSGQETIVVIKSKKVFDWYEYYLICIIILSALAVWFLVPKKQSKKI